MSERPPSQLESRVGFILEIGSISSTAMLAAGLLLVLAEPESTSAGLLLRAGVIVLMSTPVARVILSIFEYATERDWLFVGLTSMVLFVLLGSLLVATAS